jgi:hypothetical protein
MTVWLEWICVYSTHCVGHTKENLDDRPEEKRKIGGKISLVLLKELVRIVVELSKALVISDGTVIDANYLSSVGIRIRECYYA